MRTRLLLLLSCIGILSVSCSGGGTYDSNYNESPTPTYSESPAPSYSEPSSSSLSASSQRSGALPEPVNYRYPNIYLNTPVTATDGSVTIGGIVVGYDSINDKILIQRNDGPLNGRVDSVDPSTIN